MTDLHVPSLIAKKRDGKVLSRREIECLVEGATRGQVQPAQLGR